MTFEKTARCDQKGLPASQECCYCGRGVLNGAVLLRCEGDHRGPFQTGAEKVSVKRGGWFASSSILAKRMRIFGSGSENNIFPSHMDTHFAQLICFH